MRRAAMILGVVALVIFGAVAAATLFVFSTAPGRAMLADLIEPQLGAALGGEATIGALEGAPPGRIVLRDVALKGPDGDWLRVDRLELDWRPFAALGGGIDIDRVAATGLDWIAPPPAKPKPARASRPFTFPETLPNLAIRNLTIADARIGEGVIGRMLTFDADGAAIMGAGDFDIRLDARSAGDLDVIHAVLRKSAAADRFEIDVAARSGAEGALSQLAGLSGPVSLEAMGAAPPDDFNASLKADIGAYGAFDGAVGGDLEQARTIRLDGTATFGPALEGLAAEVGGTAAIAISVAAEPDGVAVAIERLEADAGAVRGRLSWTNRGAALFDASAALEATLADDFRPEAQAWTGNTLALVAAIKPARGAYALSADLTAGGLILTLEDGATDLRSRFAGRVRAAAAASDALPDGLKGGGEAAAKLSYADDTLAFDDASATLADGTRLSARGEADFAARTFAASGSGAVMPGLAGLFVDGMTLADAATFDIDAHGAFDQFEAAFDLDAPTITVNGREIPASTVTAALSGLPSLPTGDVRASAVTGGGRIEASVRSSEDGRIMVPSLVARGEGFSLQGSGAFDPAAEAVTLDLAYDGETGAEPWPGLTLWGAATVKGSIGRGGAAHTLTIAAPSLVSEDFLIADLKARLAGPPARLALTATAEAIEAPGVGRVATLSTTGLLDLRETAILTLNTFEARIGDTPVRLSAPAKISTGEGLAIENVRAAIGRAGALSIDGALTATRWRLKAEARDAPIRSAAASASFSVDLDTDRPAPASGSFSVSSRLIEETAALIAGKFSWDGTRLSVINNDPTDSIEMDLALPLRLIRAPALSVATEGPIGGDASYSGPAQAIAAYLPTSLQSLEGDLMVSADLAGDTKSPRVTGALEFTNGAYTEYASGLSLVGIRAQATARPEGAGSVIDITAEARGSAQKTSSITFEGRVRLAEAASIDGLLKLDRTEFAAGPVDKIEASGDIKFTGPVEQMVLSGAIEIAELDLEVVTPDATGLVDIAVTPIDGVTGAAANTDAAPELAPPSLAFDITVEANDRIFVRGRGLDSEWRANIRASGDTANPSIVGALNLRRGFIDFSGRRFTMTRGEIAFDRLVANDPTIDIRAEFETGEGVLAAIEIKGRASRPQVTLVSTPTLPQEDIMALVLFGKPATELSAIESLQMAQALAQLGGIGGFGGSGFARRALGLDMFNLDLDPETGAGSLEVGKYVADGLFVSAIQDAKGENGAVRVQYEISNSITVETEIKQTGDQTVSANWKYDF